MTDTKTNHKRSIEHFRIHTVKRPTAAMPLAMPAADVGEDVIGEDPTDQ
jgi:hypothetical protein